MTVGAGKSCTESIQYSGPIPANGVVYVENIVLRNDLLAFHRHLPSHLGCGNAYIHGDYSGQLTVATENDIIIDGNLDLTAVKVCSASSPTTLSASTIPTPATKSQPETGTTANAIPAATARPRSPIPVSTLQSSRSTTPSSSITTTAAPDLAP